MNFNGSQYRGTIGTEKRTFNPAPLFLVPTGVSPHDVAAADFNGDGRQDLAVSNLGSGTVTILLGQGDDKTSSTRRPEGLAVGPSNGDGRPDLAFADLGDYNCSAAHARQLEWDVAIFGVLFNRDRHRSLCD